MMKHLTDNEIQSYLHSLTSDERARSEDHLKGCSDCQEKLLLYKKLGDVVVSSSSNPIPKGFERAVMGRLRSTQRQKRLNDVIVTAAAIIGFVLIGSVVFLTPQFKHIVTICLTDSWQYGRELVTATEGSSDAIAVLAFGAALLVLFAVIDRFALGRLRFASGLRGYSETD
jgi:anti-sigma factor RsiW